MENNGLNSQFQNEGQQNLGGMAQPTNTVSNPKLPKATKIASIGMSVVMLGSIISMIISFAIQSQMGSYGNATSTSLASVIGIGIVILFLVLAQKMKTAKSKTLPIVLIVFSSIFVGFGVIGMILIGAQLSVIESAAKTSAALSRNFSQSAVDSIKQMIIISYIPSFISIVGWGITLYGSIVGNTATQEEFLANN